MTAHALARLADPSASFSTGTTWCWKESASGSIQLRAETKVMDVMVALALGHQGLAASSIFRTFHETVVQLPEHVLRLVAGKAMWTAANGAVTLSRTSWPGPPQFAVMASRPHMCARERVPAPRRLGRSSSQNPCDESHPSPVVLFAVDSESFPDDGGRDCWSIYQCRGSGRLAPRGRLLQPEDIVGRLRRRVCS